jgi:glycosyltransferase involved in cell wall biosynthesis
MAIALTVIIPTYRRSAYLIEALQSVIAQKTRFSFEILVLDNACDSTLHGEVERVAADSLVPVRYIPVPEIGLHNGRNTGAKAARGEFLVFVDDDIIAVSGWLQAIVDAFNDHSVHLVGGPSWPLYEGNLPDWLDAFWQTSVDSKRLCNKYLSLQDFGREPCEIYPDFIWGLNFAIRKETLHKLGGFRPDSVPWVMRRFRGDGEMAVTHNARSLGLKALYHPGALVFHRVPQNRMTLEYFTRRAYLNGISESFTDIRSNGVIKPTTSSGSFFDWKAPLRRAKQLARQYLMPEQPHPSEPSHGIKTKVRAAYQAGYDYHQNEVRKDPALLAWVLKLDYWEGVIPHSSEPRNKMARRKK